MACGGANADAMVRSQREYELAAGLFGENNVPGALQHFTTALELDPTNAEAHLMLGYVYLTEHAYRDYAKSETHLRRALEIVQEDPQGMRRGLVPEAHNMLGTLYINQHRYDDAIRELQIAVADIQNRVPHLAWGNLGWAHYEKGNYPAALDALDHALRLQPRFCVGHYRVGQVRFAMHELMEAEQALTQALESDPSCATGFQEAYSLRGQVRAQNGRREDAISDFERCLEMGSTTETGRACQRFLQPE